MAQRLLDDVSASLPIPVDAGLAVPYELALQQVLEEEELLLKMIEVQTARGSSAALWSDRHPLVGSQVQSAAPSPAQRPPLLARSPSL